MREIKIEMERRGVHLDETSDDKEEFAEEEKHHR